MAAFQAAYSRSSATPYVLVLLALVGILLAVPPFLSEPAETLEISPVFLMAAPVLLILLIKWLSSSHSNNYGVSYSPSAVEVSPPTSSIGRAGGSPAGVALVLLIVLVMIWYQSAGIDDSEE